ncbi:MAG: hypothetical protein VZR36_13745 [Prevotella sp.]|nr:hypothetical protein [Prevotella sp.]
MKAKDKVKSFYRKHEPEIIVSAIQGPGFGIAIVIQPNGAPLWAGVLVCVSIIILSWVTAYLTRAYENKKKREN